MDISNAFAAKPHDFPSLVAAWQLSEQQSQRRRSVRLYRAGHITGLNPLQRYLVFIDHAQVGRMVAAHRGVVHVLDPVLVGKSGLYAQLRFDHRPFAAVYTNEHAPALLVGEQGFSIVQLDR